MTVTINALNVSDQAAAIKTQLEAFPELTQVPVTVSEDRNLDPNGCPWIGIYRLGTQFVQRTLGYGSGMRDQRTRFLVLVQQSDHSGGEACSAALDELLQNVISALLSDTSLRGSTGTIDEFEVDYVSYDRSSNVYMQTAALQFVAVGNTIATQNP
jgi:hypothetical protein